MITFSGQNLTRFHSNSPKTVVEKFVNSCQRIFDTEVWFWTDDYDLKQGGCALDASAVDSSNLESSFFAATGSWLPIKMCIVQ